VPIRIMMRLHYDALVRTTIDLPADLHQLTTALARSHDQSLSQTIADILRRALLTGNAPAVSTDAATGLPVVHLGRPITDQDVAVLEDDT
jgi:plasmid stability protein